MTPLWFKKYRYNLNIYLHVKKERTERVCIKMLMIYCGLINVAGLNFFIFCLCNFPIFYDRENNFFLLKQDWAIGDLYF